MTTAMILHEVDDVDHWLRSPKREEVFGPMGITLRTFVDPAGTNRVGLVADIPLSGTTKIEETVGGAKVSVEVPTKITNFGLAAGVLGYF